MNNQSSEGFIEYASADIYFIFSFVFDFWEEKSYLDLVKRLEEINKKTLEEYDLNLISLKSVDALPKEGKNLVIVAKIDDFYHVCIFDRTGNKVIDKGKEDFLPDNELFQQLEVEFSRQLEEEEFKRRSIDNQTKSELIHKIRSSLGQTKEKWKIEGIWEIEGTPPDRQGKPPMLVIKRKKTNEQERNKTNEQEGEYIPTAVYKELISDEEVDLTYMEEVDPKVKKEEFKDKGITYERPDPFKAKLGAYIRIGDNGAGCITFKLSISEKKEQTDEEEKTAGQTHTKLNI